MNWITLTKLGKILRNGVSKVMEDWVYRGGYTCPKFGCTVKQSYPRRIKCKRGTLSQDNTSMATSLHWRSEGRRQGACSVFWENFTLSGLRGDSLKIKRLLILSHHPIQSISYFGNPKFLYKTQSIENP